MPEMLIALPAHKLCSFPTVGSKLIKPNTIVQVLPEGRKPAAGIEFLCRFKQRVATGCTDILACGVLLISKIEMLFLQG